MSDFDDTAPDGPMDPDQQARASLLTAAQLDRIDRCIMSHITPRQQKVAKVIALTMQDIGDEFPGIPDVFYASRIKHLGASGAIEAFGNLDRMRYSEIRLPYPKSNS